MTVIIDRKKPTFHWLLETAKEFAVNKVADIECSPDKETVAEAANVLAVFPKFYEGFDTLLRIKNGSSTKAWKASHRHDGLISLTIDNDLAFKDDAQGELQEFALMQCDEEMLHIAFTVYCSSPPPNFGKVGKILHMHRDLLEILEDYLPEANGARLEFDYLKQPLGWFVTATIPFQLQMPMKSLGFSSYPVLDYAPKPLEKSSWHTFGDPLFAHSWSKWNELAFRIMSGEYNTDVVFKNYSQRSYDAALERIGKSKDACFDMIRRIVNEPTTNFHKWRKNFKIHEKYHGYFVASTVFGLKAAVDYDAKELVNTYNLEYALPRARARIGTEQLKAALNTNFETEKQRQIYVDSQYPRKVERIC